MKKVVLSIAIVAVGFVTTSCSKSYDCDCQTSSTGKWATVKVKAANVDEAKYVCEDEGTAPGTPTGTEVDCQLR